MTANGGADVLYTDLYARRGKGIRGSAIDQTLSLLERVERDVIPLAMGCPADTAFPLETVRETMKELLAAEGPELLNYGVTEGDLELRQFLAERMRTREGVNVGPENVLITTGGMQGLDLTFKLFLNPGDRVAVEQPTYANAIATIANYEGRFLEVPVDQEGMRVDVLAERLREPGGGVKLVYVIPTFQNPAGVTLSYERRVQLIELARRHRLLIVEDDPYRDLRYEGELLPSLYALDEGRGSVISVNTFAKVFSPGVRVGWVVAPQKVIARMVAARQSMDTCTNQLGQRLVTRFCLDGQLDAHIEGLRAQYRARRDRMLAALERHFADVPGAHWTRPDGGFFIWMTLPRPADTERLFEAALQEGVAFVPGAAFAPTAAEELRACLRLNFTFPTLDDIDEGVARLRRALAKMHGSKVRQSARVGR